MSCILCKAGAAAVEIADQALAEGLAPRETAARLLRSGVSISTWAIQVHKRHREQEVAAPPPPLPAAKPRKKTKTEPEPVAQAAGFAVVEVQPVHPQGLRDMVRTLAVELEVAQRQQIEIVQRLQQQLLAGEAVSTRAEIASLKTLDDLLRRLREFREAELSLPVDVRVVLPPIRTADDIAQALQAITDAALSGRITHAEAKLLADVLDRQREVLKLRYFEHRLRELEARIIGGRAVPVALIEGEADVA